MKTKQSSKNREIIKDFYTKYHKSDVIWFVGSLEDNEDDFDVDTRDILRVSIVDELIEPEKTPKNLDYVSIRVRPVENQRDVVSEESLREFCAKHPYLYQSRSIDEIILDVQRPLWTLYPFGRHNGRFFDNEKDARNQRITILREETNSCKKQIDYLINEVHTEIDFLKNCS